MVPKWYQTNTKMRKMQITPENLVQKLWYQEVGPRTIASELEPMHQYQNRDGFIKSVPSKH